MKIVIDLTSLDDNFSGIERYAHDITVNLLENDRENEYILVFKHQIHEDFLGYIDMKKVHGYVLKRNKKLIFYQWILPLFLNRLEANLFLFLAFPAPFLLRGKRFWYTAHDMGCFDCPETMKKKMVWYYRLLHWSNSRRCDGIITISQFSKERIISCLHCAPEKVHVIYCGISDVFCAAGYTTDESMKKVRQKYNLPEHYLLCLSTLEPRKNMILLLQAYLELKQEGKISCGLVLAGRKGWKIENLLQRIQTEETGKKENESGEMRIQLTGFVDEKDLPVLYQMADCFVFPSLYEGFGIPPLEALQMGTTVISSDAPAMREVLGNAVFYFKNGDKEALKQTILQALAEKEDRLAGKKATGKERCSLFQYKKETEKLLKLWKEEIK